MIAIEADFNHLDGSGRLVLSDLVIHQSTPFAEVAALAAADNHRPLTSGRLQVASEPACW
jgi:hypothetical protein